MLFQATAYNGALTSSIGGLPYGISVRMQVRQFSSLFGYGTNCEIRITADVRYFQKRTLSSFILICRQMSNEKRAVRDDVIALLELQKRINPK